MKRKTLLFFILLAISTSGFAKEDPVLGNWLLTKAVVGDNTQELYSEVVFKPDGTAEMSGREFGTWAYDKKTKTVTINSDIIQEFAGEWQITTSGKSEMKFNSDKTQLYFIKMDMRKIAADNEKSGFTGVWKLETMEGTMYMKFSTPNLLATYTKMDYGSSTGKGTWMINPDKHTLILLTNDRELAGSSQIKSINGSSFILEKNGQQYTGEKLAGVTKTIAPLAFTTDDIYDSYNEDPYAVSLESTNISWLNPEARIAYLKNVKKLTYTYSSVLEGINMMISEDITTEIGFDEDYNSIDIAAPIFGELSADGYDESNPFFPVRGPGDYRVTGEETITVPAGTFACTVIEAVGDFDGDKEKFYLIRNRPGIYARIIIAQGEGDEQQLSQYELAAIEANYQAPDAKGVAGQWLVAKTVSGGNETATSTLMEFIDDGRLSVDNTTQGSFYTWSADMNAKTLSMNIDGATQEFKIAELNGNKMVLTNDAFTYNLVKWDNATITANNNKSTLKGYWLLTNSDYEFSVLELADDNRYYGIENVLEIPIEANYTQFGGKWLHLTEEATLVFSNYQQQSNLTGSYKLTTLTDNMMVLDGKMEYRRIDPEKITKANKESGLEGVWQLKDINGNPQYYAFAAPYAFKRGDNPDYLNTQGLWFYNPETQVLFVGVAMHQLGGATKVTEITKDKITFENGLELTRVQ